MKKCISVESLSAMNENKSQGRRRRRNLLIVEGNHEKDKLFWLMFRCFPEIDIGMDDIWIYGTNIYMLYDDIVKEYGPEWSGDDIDLPFVVSKKQGQDQYRYKNDFINIILVFDYERHDPNFSETKILEMQRYFNDAADVGQLYINYPMIESYQHLKKLPDPDFAERKVPVSLRPGKQYKALVRQETVIAKWVEFPHKIESALSENLRMSDEQAQKRCCEKILSLSEECGIEDKLRNILTGIIRSEEIQTVKHRFLDWIWRQGYVCDRQTYWEHMRMVFQQIVLHNIRKANRIWKGNYHVSHDECKACFEALDLAEILNIQNMSSLDLEEGFIWVLNTCVFFIAEYNFSLISK